MIKQLEDKNEKFEKHSPKIMKYNKRVHLEQNINNFRRNVITPRVNFRKNTLIPQTKELLNQKCQNCPLFRVNDEVRLDTTLIPQNNNIKREKKYKENKEMNEELIKKYAINLETYEKVLNLFSKHMHFKDKYIQKIDYTSSNF